MQGYTLYLIFGLVLVVILILAIVYYFSAKRKKHIEEPKYEMLKDDEKLP